MKNLFIITALSASLALLSGCREEKHHSHSDTVMGNPYNDPYYNPNQSTGGGGSQIGGHDTGGGGSQTGGHQHSTGGGGSQTGGGGLIDSPYYRGPSEALPQPTTGGGSN